MCLNLSEYCGPSCRWTMSETTIFFYNIWGWDGLRSVPNIYSNRCLLKGGRVLFHIKPSFLCEVQTETLTRGLARPVLGRPMKRKIDRGRARGLLDIDLVEQTMGLDHPASPQRPNFDPFSSPTWLCSQPKVIVSIPPQLTQPLRDFFFTLTTLHDNCCTKKSNCSIHMNQLF
jgi:hypothetical protein